MGSANEHQDRPRRMVSLVPSQTELLADLGLDAEVVGITRFCVHPASWKARKTIVGGTKNVHVDRVKALQPDLILANKEENTRADVEALHGVAPVHVTDVATVADAFTMIETVGKLVGKRSEAEELVATIQARVAAMPVAEPMRALYLIWRDPYMTVGGDTFIHDVMRLGGFANVCGAATRYPELTPATLQAMHPDVVLLSSEPYPFKAKHIAEILALLPDVPVCLVDGEPFSWYGSRMLQMPTYVADVRRRIAEMAT